MSAKWRALQHRHRYTYAAVSFPPSFSAALARSSLSAGSPPFYLALQRLLSLNSTYSQLAHAKNLAATFVDLLQSYANSQQDPANQHLLSEAARFYLEILFMENSLPLHRTLVGVLSKTSNFHSVILASFRQLCDEYGSVFRKGKPFRVSRVALSVMSMPKLSYLVDAIQDCALLVARDIVHGLDGVVLETREWARPSPTVMEQCQEALSCLYYLLQRFPEKFQASGPQYTNMMEGVVGVLLSILKSEAFSRDCFVAAGVTFFAAIQVCLGAERLGRFIIRGIFDLSTCGFDTNHGRGLGGASCKIPYEGDILLEIRSLSTLSRLCLIRGMLTAVSRSIITSPFFLPRDSENEPFSTKTILFDGILPELCSYCENPIDSHFNFHALTVLQICLQQIKTAVLADPLNSSEDYDPMPESMETRILRIIWNNLEDPLSQTVKQVHLCFDLFLDIHSSLHQRKGNEKIKSFLEMIASDVLRLGPRCKGRYVPLGLLTQRLGAKTILRISPNLLFETMEAYSDDDVCCAATSFLKCFLEYLRDVRWSDDGIENGYGLCRGHCLPPILLGLASGVPKLRSNLNTYALPALLEVDADGIFPMLAFVSVMPSEGVKDTVHSQFDLTKVELSVEQKVAVLVSLLKVSRAHALIEGDIDLCNDIVKSNVDDGSISGSLNTYACICIKGIKVTIPVWWFVLALTHMDESLRIDAAETLFLNPKASSLPSKLELTLMKKAVPLNMRSSSTGFQMKWTSMFRKFFSRVRTALERQVKMHGLWPHMNHEGSEVFTSKIIEKLDCRAEELFNFMRWLSRFLFFSCYPSAPYKRKIMAMELIQIMLNIWPISPSQENVAFECCLSPYNAGITSPDSTLLFVGSVIDGWDRLRESSFQILLHFPTPLPGISEENMVHKVITWAKELMCSPRVRESDAGALTLRLIFRKYVLELGWTVGASVNVLCYPQKSEISQPRHPVVEYIQSLIDWLDFAVKEGEKDLFEACKNSFVHGVVLALRYTFEELDWNSDAVLSSTTDMRAAMSKLLDLVMQITSLALWVVSADAWYLPDDVDEMIDDDDGLLLEGTGEMAVPRSQLEKEEKSSKGLVDGKPPAHIVMVGCWLAMKEVSLLFGTIIRKIPLLSNSSSDSSEFDSPLSGAPDILETTMSDGVLNLKQLEKIGSHFLEVLLKMKHNGAIDKTRAGFTALCNRLLCSNSPRLCKLTESWMEQLMEKTVARGQVVDDLLRRSAGIPAAFIALFLSEPEGAPKKLLPTALRWLIDLADGLLLKQAEGGNSNISSCLISSSKSKQGTYMSVDIDQTERISKIRDEGVIPTVHAFNVLRAAFNDTNLATDTSGFAAEALIISIRSFSSPYWEVRNSACLAYTALVRRMIGFLNIQKRESARRALTGLEFFHRYPSLHPFLFNELDNATELLDNRLTDQSESNLLKVVHPSLCPMLILLCRLKPSSMASETGDDLDPYLFMPFIRKCSIQSNLRIRVLASWALTGLVSDEKLSSVILDIASELPHSEEQIAEVRTSTISVCSVNGRRQSSFNLIHGALLQLGSLLDGNCRNLADILEKDQIVGNLITILAMSSWIGRPRRCRCPILNSCFLRVLDHMLSIARTCYTSKNIFAVQRLLLECSIECLDLGASCGLPYFDPTTAELHQQAATSYLHCIFHPSDEVGGEVLQLPKRFPLPEPVKMPGIENTFAGPVERLACLLSDSSYEVRLVTLKWLLKFLKSKTYSNTHEPSTEIRSIKNWAKTELQVTLIKHLQAEKHHRCTCYILRIIYAWNLLNSPEFIKGKCSEIVSIGAMNGDSVFELWDMLMSLYKLTRHSKTREPLICCMAICVRKFATLIVGSDGQKILKCDESWQSERSSCFYDCITFFVSIIKQHSSSVEPVNMRKAAAESVIASGLLKQAECISLSIGSQQVLPESSLQRSASIEVDKYVYVILEIWFTCVKLLEDEDDEIRQRLAEDVRTCLFVISPRGDFNREAPTQVEKIIEQCFDYLSSSFCQCIEYYDYLLRWVLDAANHVIHEADLVRRVFDKEIDNHHEEKLLVCQICCSHVENIGITQSWAGRGLNGNELLKYLLEWRMRFCSQLMLFVKDYTGKLGANWIGGLGNHKDAFQPIYANLLGCYALSKCILNMKPKLGVYTDLLMNVLEIGKAIDPFLRNPLISNLYLVLVRLHEKGCQATDQYQTKPREGFIWVDFNPYFLLT